MERPYYPEPEDVPTHPIESNASILRETSSVNYGGIRFSISDTPPIFRGETTQEIAEAIKLFDDKESPIFITGNAGTGKSTLLRYLRRRRPTNLAVLAPTGIAAVNIGAETIHSFFRFPPRLLQERSIEIHKDRVGMYSVLETIIVDEISMVRADLLDAIDVSLRLHRSSNEPFGGVQMVLIGDICQLPPVVTRDLEEYFSHFYPTPYFFSAKAIASGALQVVELTKVFRQKDPNYVDILNKIRRNRLDRSTLESINGRAVTHGLADLADDTTVLTTTNKAADQINWRKLAAIPTSPVRFHAQIEGDFKKDLFPADDPLVLKKGARVMMLKNNGSDWQNGTVGVVERFDDTDVIVLLNGRSCRVERQRWSVVQYRYDRKARRVYEVEVGSFTQFPMRLAWAITIHKSQGQTLQKIAVDLGSGAFAHGQVYVALSRCPSLEGVTLTRPLRTSDICFDPRVLSIESKS